MDEMTVRVLSDLARLYENRSRDASPEEVLYYQGGASALRQALAFMAGPPTRSTTNGSNGEHAPPSSSVPCLQCGKLFKSKQAASAHLFQSHGVRTNPKRRSPKPGGSFACEECDKVYEYVQHLGMHRKRVHGHKSLRDLQVEATARA